MFKALVTIAFGAAIMTAQIALIPTPSTAQGHRVEKITVYAKHTAAFKAAKKAALGTAKRRRANIKAAKTKAKPRSTTATKPTKDASSASSVSASQ